MALRDRSLGIRLPGFLPRAILSAALAAVTFATAPSASLSAKQLPKPDKPPVCFFVSSHNAEDPWDGEIMAGLKAAVGGSCDIEAFYLDTLRNPALIDLVTSATKAYRRIKEIEPDVVIACDDAASRYLVVPYLKGGDIPIIFCGVDWTVERHGYPFENSTGIIEHVPVENLITDTLKTVEPGRYMTYLAADLPGQRDAFRHIRDVAAQHDLPVIGHFIRTMSEWEEVFKSASEQEIIMLAAPVGIINWNMEAAREAVTVNTRPFTIAIDRSMAPLAMLTMTNTGVEQGEWAGAVAKLILEGEKAQSIPIVASRRWTGYQNPTLLGAGGYRLPTAISHHVRPYQ